MMETVIYNQRSGEKQTLSSVAASNLIRTSGGEWASTPPLPRNWGREIPIYEATRAVNPSPLDRMRYDPPWSAAMDETTWQYAAKPIAAGEIVETTSWPHESFMPLNDSARQVHAFFVLREKSRMTLSPWHNGRVRLETGHEGAATPVLHRRIHASTIETSPT